MWELTFQVPVFPFRWDLKILCIKNSGNEILKKYIIIISKALNICILIFHCNSPHTPTNIYFLWGLYVIARNWENVKFPRDSAYFGYLISFLDQVINDQSHKHKSSWWQSFLFHVFMLTYLTFTWEFSFWEFSACASEVSIETLSNVFTIVW